MYGEQKKNAPPGVFDISHYKGYEDVTYNWKLLYEDGDFVMWEYFDGVEWAKSYCACYKGKAYVCGDNFETILDMHEGARLFLEFTGKVEGN